MAPWVIIGDFNEIISNQEKVGGRLQADRPMRDFRDALEYYELVDMSYRGRLFTWEGENFASNNIRERLDRGVASDDWFQLFPYYVLSYLTSSISDHCPFLLNTMVLKRNKMGSI